MSFAIKNYLFHTPIALLDIILLYWIFLIELSIKKDIAVAKITPGGPKPTNLAKNIDRGIFKKETKIIKQHNFKFSDAEFFILNNFFFFIFIL